ncbi:hypothetical protein Hokovirus_1_151 [Hokovirus HKV1]|uniref:Uncharacterized protein n=1 Tax=Hokovirus HKV1 TaxID=1977638 RepID=A0A1V0SEY0_9VIRU|nr:hypothetical protein Hokovirus_1_151 [Hokovirus HKV1]
MYNINFPWKLYPVNNYKNIMSEYDHYKIYKKNTLKFYNFISNYKTYDTIDYNNLILYLCIGNPMDEYYYCTNNAIGCQWQQLFPMYLENHKNVLLMIITPDISYLNNEPLFMKNTKHYGWTKKNTNTYISLKYKVVVKIFITPFITLDNENNNNINILNNTTNKKILNIINSLIQTEQDKIFISNFYTKFTDFINFMNGLVICNYLAVFNSPIYEKYNDFYFCEELKKIMNKHLLLTWTYDLKNTESIIYCILNKLYLNTSKINYCDNKYFNIIYLNNKPVMNFIIINEKGYLDEINVLQVDKFTDFKNIAKYRRIICMDINNCIILKNKMKCYINII